jgi:hypothetical protein
MSNGEVLQGTSAMALKGQVWDQESKVRELVRERKRPLKHYSRILQAIINDDEIRITPKVAPDGWVHIRSDFDSAKDMLAGYTKVVDRDNKPVEPRDISMIIRPVDAVVKPVRFPKTTSGKNVFDLCGIYGSNVADPGQLFTFGTQAKEFSGLVYTFWKDAGGTLFYACVDPRSWGSVEVSWLHPTDEYTADCYLLICQ